MRMSNTPDMANWFSGNLYWLAASVIINSDHVSCLWEDELLGTWPYEEIYQSVLHTLPLLTGIAGSRSSSTCAMDKSISGLKQLIAMLGWQVVAISITAWAACLIYVISNGMSRFIEEYSWRPPPETTKVSASRSKPCLRLGQMSASELDIYAVPNEVIPEILK